MNVSPFQLLFDTQSNAAFIQQRSSAADERLRTKLFFPLKKMLLTETQGDAGRGRAWFGGWEEAEPDPSAATLTPELQ